jgi:hypothetical protein
MVPASTACVAVSCPYLIGGVEDWKVDGPAGQPLENVRERRDRAPRPRARRAPPPTRSELIEAGTTDALPNSFPLW